MKAYSQDLRERIVAAVAAGRTKAATARTFSVSLAAVKNYVRHLETTGSLAPRQRYPRQPVIGVAQHAALIAQLTAASDATLAEHVEQWAKDHGVRVSVTTMSRTIRRVGWTYKKRLWVPASATRWLGSPSALRSPGWLPIRSSRSTRRPAPLR